MTKFPDFLEVEAPLVSARIEAIKKIKPGKIPTYAFIGPLLPHFINNKDEINKLLDTLQEAGITEVWFEHINLSPKIKDRLFEYLEKNPRTYSGISKSRFERISPTTKSGH